RRSHERDSARSAPRGEKEAAAKQRRRRRTFAAHVCEAASAPGGAVRERVKSKKPRTQPTGEEFAGILGPLFLMKAGDGANGHSRSMVRQCSQLCVLALAPPHISVKFRAGMGALMLAAYQPHFDLVPHRGKRRITSYDCVN